MKNRLSKLASCLNSQGLDAFVVTKDVNIRYLTEYPFAESWLLVTRHRAILLTDGRYVQEAQRHLGAAAVWTVREPLPRGLRDICRQENVRRLGFEPKHLSVYLFRQIETALRPKTRLVATEGLIEAMRIRKGPRELRRIRKAVSLALQSQHFLKRILRPGLSEREVLHRLEDYVKAKGASLSFPAIIASGPNTSLPHARPTDRKFRRDEIILVDMGIDVGGYKSDLTRMFFLGKISKPIEDVYALIRQAQRLAISKIRAGVRARDVDRVARNFLKEKGLDQYFVHSLGHGVGLEIHEAPGISSKNPLLLKQGMVLTVEPGVYFPGQFGVRYEDMVLVTSSGCKVLSK